jgi:hypothetical protein
VFAPRSILHAFAGVLLLAPTAFIAQHQTTATRCATTTGRWQRYLPNPGVMQAIANANN